MNSLQYNSQDLWTSQNISTKTHSVLIQGGIESDCVEMNVEQLELHWRWENKKIMQYKLQFTTIMCNILCYLFFFRAVCDMIKGTLNHVVCWEDDKKVWKKNLP